MCLEPVQARTSAIGKENGGGSDYEDQNEADGKKKAARVPKKRPTVGARIIE